MEQEPVMRQLIGTASYRDPWNNGNLVGQKGTAQAQGHLRDPGSIAAF